MKHWEEHLKSRIEIRFYPAILAFLGYNPLPEPKTPGEEMRRKRRSLGLSQRRLAALTNTDEGTVARLERDTRGMARQSREKVTAYFDATSEREQFPNHSCSSKHSKTPSGVLSDLIRFAGN
jgi:ribosome-binding protein aMBF1 (putative translation factor)